MENNIKQLYLKILPQAHLINYIINDISYRHFVFLLYLTQELQMKCLAYATIFTSHFKRLDIYPCRIDCLYSK